MSGPATKPERHARITEAMLGAKINHRTFRVLTAIAFHAGPGGRCSMSNVTLARLTGIDRHGVIKAVAELVETGWIAVVIDGSRREITVNGGCVATTQGVCRHDTQGECRHDTGGVSSRHRRGIATTPKQSSEQSIEQPTQTAGEGGPRIADPEPELDPHVPAPDLEATRIFEAIKSLVIRYEGEEAVRRIPGMLVECPDRARLLRAACDVAAQIEAGVPVRTFTGLTKSVYRGGSGPGVAVAPPKPEPQPEIFRADPNRRRWARRRA